MNQVENFAKSVAGTNEQALDGNLPRAATVVEVKGKLVRVKFAEETVAGQTWYPCVVGGLVTIGTVGVVQKLRGNAGYFQPIGMIPATTEFETLQNSSLVGTTLVAASATDTANMLDVFSGALKDLIPACKVGIWKVLVTFSVTASRNTNSGGLTVYAGIGTGGNGIIPRGLTVINTPIAGTVSYKADGVLPTTVIRGMFGGQGSPGTTTRSAASMAITAVRTG